MATTATLNLVTALATPEATKVTPYFDDYSEDKNFHRVLFKPGVAVQSRELTQTQTILQNQIKRVGDYLFSDGQKVTGSKPSVNLDVRTVRITGRNTIGQPITLDDCLEKYVTSLNSEIVGYVEFVYEKDDPVIDDLPSVVISLKRYNTTNNGIFAEGDTLYFHDTYSQALNGITTSLVSVVENNIVKNAIGTCTPFSKIINISTASTSIEVGDLVVHPNITKTIYVTEIINQTQYAISETPATSFSGENIQFTKLSTCPSSIVTQDETYFYKNGFLVKCPRQKIVPDKNTSYPSKVIGLYVTEQIITSDDDVSLLDPALGSSNYFATGADRLKIDLSLTSFDMDINRKADTEQIIIPLLVFNKGLIEYVPETTVSSQIQQQIEQRTFDESGNYVVKPFTITPTGSVEDDTLLFNVSSGRAYVAGREISTISGTEISLPKVTATDTKTGYNITTSQGNYIKITDLNYAGSNMQLPIIQTKVQGEMYLEVHNVTNPTSANSANTKVGTLLFKSLEYDSSLGANSKTQFKLFYHYYSPVIEAPLTWAAWSAEYGISVADGQYIANVLYSSPAANTLLGKYGVASTPCFALYREPDSGGVAFWYNTWHGLDGRDIEKTKSRFANYLLATPTNSDSARMLSNTKAFLSFNNGSPFIDGLLNVNQVKSIIGVANNQTSHYTGATYTDPIFYANVAASAIDAQNNLIISDPRSSDLLVFRIPKTSVKSVDNLRTTYNKTIRGAIFTAGIFSKSVTDPETFALGDGVVNPSTARVNFIIAIRTGATANVPLGVWNFERGTATISQDSTILTVNLGDATFTGVADIEYVVESNALPPRIKTRVKNAYQFANVNVVDYKYSTNIADIEIYNGIFKLNTSDKFKGNWQSNVSYTYNDVVVDNGSTYRASIPSSNIAVTRANTWTELTDITSSLWILSNGQKDGWYDHGYVQYVGSSAALPGNVLITYDYFTHAGEGPCTVNSYPANTKIYAYTSVIDAKQYNLRDCLDFRPKRVNGSQYLNFETAIFPTSAVNTEADVTYFLARIDKLYVTADSRNFENPYSRLYVERGVEANNARNTADSYQDKLKLTIATLYIPPYATSSFDVKIVYEDSRRFTMNDINKLQRATISLNRKVRIHSVEIANLKNPVLNDAGDNLLKTGILIENFTDFSKSDLTNQDFLCAFDVRAGICSPLFTATDMPLEITSATNYSINDGIITAKYSEEIFTSQLEANHYVNPNPGGINNGRGRSKLGKKSSFGVNLLLTLVLGFAALTTYYYFGGAALLGITASLTAGAIGLSVAAAYNTVVAGISVASAWVYNVVLANPYVWAALAVIAVLQIAGVDVVGLISDTVDSVGDVISGIGGAISDAGSDFDDYVHNIFSDIRTKEKVKFINQVIPGLNLYSFEYKPEFKNHPLAGLGRHIGFMAHEVEKLYPNAVQVQPNGYKSVNYSLIGI